MPRLVNVKPFVELEKAFEARDWDLHQLKIDPFMDPLRGDPRFKDLQMTQFTVEDGWIALAYSPRRVSSNVARKPQ